MIYLMRVSRFIITLFSSFLKVVKKPRSYLLSGRQEVKTLLNRSGRYCAATMHSFDVLMSQNGM